MFTGLEVPCGDVAISARPEILSAFRITMAAIDPSAEAEGEEGAPQRATLKVIRQPLGDDYDDDEDDDEFDADEFERRLAEEDDEDDNEDDEETNGGPSDPKKSKKARKEAAEAEIRKMLMEEGMDVDEDDSKPNGVAKSAKAKGKMPASDEEDDEDDEDDDDMSDEGEVEEFVICTLDPQKVSFTRSRSHIASAHTDLCRRTTSSLSTSPSATTSVCGSRLAVPTASS